MINVGQWDSHVTAIVGALLLVSLLVLLLILLALNIIFCRKRPFFCSSEGDSNPRDNGAFDLTDETDPTRIEERVNARQRALYCEDTRADVALKNFDRSMGKALAVEQLLHGSYVFDTHILERPPADVLVLAAKRDYL